MTREKFAEAQRLDDMEGHLVWEINLLENAEKNGAVAIYPTSDASGNHRIVIRGEQAAKAIQEWIEAKRAELAETRAEFAQL